jgi:hypothetical protein
LVIGVSLRCSVGHIHARYRPDCKSKDRGSPVARSGPATSPSVRSIGSGSANQPTRRREANTRAVSGARAKKAALRELLVAVGERFDPVTDTGADRWALRYLESSRPTSVLAPVRLSADDQVKLAHGQADQMVSVIRAVLEGLKLSDADYTRGIDLAIGALRASSSQGWEPL